MAKVNKKRIDELMDGFEAVCRERDLRITHQRTEIYRELAVYPGHPTVENVFKQVRKRLKTISLDTVYRTIVTFEKYGLVRRVQVLDNAARYDINLDLHHHLVCTRCKKVLDFYWPDFDRMKPPAAINGWSDIVSKHVEIRGLCRDCRNKAKKK